MIYPTDPIQLIFFLAQYPQYKNIPAGLGFVGLPDNSIKVAIFLDEFDTHGTIRDRTSMALDIVEDLAKYQGKVNFHIEFELKKILNQLDLQSVIRF